MRARPVVFLGPSLPVGEARRLLAADYRPPVRRGDFEGLSPRVPVVMIDGEFDQSLSVSPKETLAFVERGGRVLGAASMGALRAAELDGLGMDGIGWIFEAYRSGRVIGDDEVALLYSPCGYEPLTVPLINVRCWLERHCAAGRVGTRELPRILRAARAIFYAERTPGRLYRRLAELLTRPRLDELLAATGGSITDIKAEDARAALRRMRATFFRLDRQEQEDDTWRRNAFPQVSTSSSAAP